MKQLSFADGVLRLGGQELPGIFSASRITGKVRYDEQKVDGTSGKNKIPQGWEDQDLVYSAVLTTDEVSDCYEKLEQITPFFQTPDSKANPQIYQLVNRHAQARGLREVVFDRLESSDNEQTDEVFVSLGFKEHNPPIIRTEGSVAKTPTPAELAEQAAQEAAKPQDDDVISGDLS